MEKQSLKQSELQQLVESISQDFFEHLPFINTKFVHKASFNGRLKTTAGRYLVGTGHIELNPSYYEKYGYGELVNTIKHELIHYHLHQMGLPYKHKDKEFKTLSDLLDIPKYAKPMRKYNYIYTCIKCGVLYYRVKKMNLKKYCCGKCRGKIALKK